MVEWVARLGLVALPTATSFTGTDHDACIVFRISFDSVQICVLYIPLAEEGYKYWDG